MPLWGIERDQCMKWIKDHYVKKRIIEESLFNKVAGILNLELL